METKLKDQAIALLQENKGQWRKTAEATGLDYNWICKLAQGSIADPGVNKIERLIGYLDDKSAA